MAGRSGMLRGWPRQPWAPRARSGMSLGTGKGGHGLRKQSRQWPHPSPATCRRRTKVSAGGGCLHDEDECPLEMLEGTCGRENVQVRAKTGLKRGAQKWGFAPSDGDLTSEEARHLGTIGFAACRAHRTAKIGGARVRSATGIPLGT